MELPLRAITFETGFMIAASADILSFVTALPARRSTIATCPVSQTVINFSDSIEHVPIFTLSLATPKVTNYKGETSEKKKLEKKNRFQESEK
jgi:hypothetical protein